MEKRIVGIKDLNGIVQNAMYGGAGQEAQAVIDWIINNDVFDLIWDPKKTHI